MLEYTAEQVAFLESSGNVVLHACPGSGKTTVVAKKMIDYLQRWDRLHQGIAILSFTNVASNEIERQVTEMLPDGFSLCFPHFIGTLDSFINNYIFLRFGYLLLKTQKRPIIAFPDIVNKYHFWRGECYKNCLSSIGDFRWTLNGTLEKNGEEIICEGKGKKDPPCVDFKKRLFTEGLFFQEEIADLVCILLNKYPEIAKCVATRFPVIILDEAQDTSQKQMQILDMLYEAGLESIYIVGDPDQSIYEWRNANPESFLEKMSDPRWTQLSLSKNFRSSQMICNATYIFSEIYKDRTANEALGSFAKYNKKPILYLYEKDATEGSIIQRFIEECNTCGIVLSPDKVAVVKRGRIHADSCVANLWSSIETEWLARASFEWMFGNRKKAYSYCEKALFQLTIKDYKEIDVSIEKEIINIMSYSQWKQFVIDTLLNLPSADEQCDQWIISCRRNVNEKLIAHNMTLHSAKSIADAIKIKSRDNNIPFFRKEPIKKYFEVKTQTTYTYSSIHGVKGETFDALLLLIRGTRGNTLTPTFLANGNTGTELMRIAYVAMTRPRKLLFIAMPKSKVNLSIRFPKEVWDYVVM